MSFIKKLTLQISLLILVISCAQKQPAESNHSDCIVNQWFTQDTTIEFQYGWNAAYGYNYCYPTHFNDTSFYLLDAKGVILDDTSAFISPDRNAIIRYWSTGSLDYKSGVIGYTITEKDIQDVENQLDSVYQRLLTQGDSTLFKSDEVKKHCLDRKNQFFAFVAEKPNTIQIVSVNLPIQAISGDKTYAYMTFEYPKQLRKIYDPIAAGLLACHKPLVK
jgi:hypothetical protein